MAAWLITTCDCLVYTFHQQLICTFACLFSYPVCVLSAVPSEPRSLMVVSITDTTVTLSWLPPDSPNGIIVGYQVQYRRNDSSDFISLNTNDIALNYTVSGLTSNVDYVFSVRAYTTVGNGTLSNEVTARASK